MSLPSTALSTTLMRGLPARFRDLEALAKKSASDINIVLCRAPSAEVAQQAFDLGVWPLHKQTARKLWEIMAAQTQGFVVLVIALPASDYSTTGRGHYLAYGVAVCPAEAEEVGAFGDGFPEACKVHWITKDIKVPYSAASRLVNGLNNNYRIELTRDGFERGEGKESKLVIGVSPAVRFVFQERYQATADTISSFRGSRFSSVEIAG